jgi:hypothetical protein
MSGSVGVEVDVDIHGCFMGFRIRCAISTRDRFTD